jgi:formylglycine-generating enzyme
MRGAACLAVAAWLGSTAGAAGERSGRVLTIAAPRQTMVHIPAGKFVMGVDVETALAASTQCRNVFPALTGYNANRVDFCEDYAETLAAMAPRDVILDAYWIDRDEVGVAEYRACVAAGACELDPLIAADGRYIRDGWPMVNVTWREAQDFCRWRGGRLPTEAEWERAARGDDPAALWPWGELEQPRDFNHGQPRAHALRETERVRAVVPLQFFGDPDDSDGHAILAPPGSYPWGTSPTGTRDQAGNVAEWTADAWIQTRDIKGYEGLPRANPLREGALHEPRVVRGGSWRQPSFLAKSNLRDPFNKEYDPKQRFSHVGFRCARSRREPHGTPTPVPGR